MSADRLEEIKARADAATEGPWHAWDRGIGWEVHKGEGCAPGRRPPCDDLNGEFRGTFTQPDAKFIAAAREDVPWLVSEIERLTRVIDAKPRQPLVVLNEYLDRAEKAETEVERLTAERDALAQIKRHIDEVRDGTGWTVQIYGVLLQQCDEYGKTVDAHRAERAEADLRHIAECLGEDPDDVPEGHRLVDHLALRVGYLRGRDAGFDDVQAERDTLAAKVRNLADWHETKADKARRFRPEVNGENHVMDKAAAVHDDAARRLRAALADPNGGDRG